MKAWSSSPALLGEQSLMVSLPCVGGGAGHGVDLPVLQQLQPLQLLLVVLAHLQDGGPRGWGRGEGSAVNTLGGSVREGAALDGPCSVASPPRHQALPPFPWLLRLLICLAASMPHPLSGGRFLVIQPRTPDGGPTSLSCLANLSRGERPTQPTLADPLMCLFFSSALLWKGNQIHRPGTTFSRADAVTSFEWSG